MRLRHSPLARREIALSLTRLKPSHARWPKARSFSSSDRRASARPRSRSRSRDRLAASTYAWPSAALATKPTSAAIVAHTSGQCRAESSRDSSKRERRIRFSCSTKSTSLARPSRVIRPAHCSKSSIPHRTTRSPTTTSAYHSISARFFSLRQGTSCRTFPARCSIGWRLSSSPVTRRRKRPRSQRSTCCRGSWKSRA